MHPGENRCVNTELPRHPVNPESEPPRPTASFPPPPAGPSKGGGGGTDRGPCYLIAPLSATARRGLRGDGLLLLLLLFNSGLVTEQNRQGGLLYFVSRAGYVAYDWIQRRRGWFRSSGGGYCSVSFATESVAVIVDERSMEGIFYREVWILNFGVSRCSWRFVGMLAILVDVDNKVDFQL